MKIIKLYYLLGRPVRLSNLTFTWRAPENDVGSIRAEASIAYNNIYVTFQSNNIPFEPFPVKIIFLPINILFFKCYLYYLCINHKGLHG